MRIRWPTAVSTRAASILFWGALASCDCDHPERGTPSGDAGAGGPAQLSPCDRLLVLQRIGFDTYRRNNYASYHDSCVGLCDEGERIAGPTLAQCIEADGAWGIVIDECPCYMSPEEERRVSQVPSDSTAWHLVHVPANGAPARSSPVLRSNGPPQIAGEEGDVSVTLQHCLLPKGSSICPLSVTHWCIGTPSGASPLDCPDLHELRRPLWLPEASREATPGFVPPVEGVVARRWTSGSQRMVIDRASGQEWIELDALPLEMNRYPAESDADVRYHPGPRLRGTLSPSGTIDFDTPEAIAWDRAECARLEHPDPRQVPPQPPGARLPPYAVSGPAVLGITGGVWELAVCLRLAGKPLSWIRDRWRRSCLQDFGPDSDRPIITPGCQAKAEENSAKWSSRNIGMPDIVGRALERVGQWP